MRLELRDLWAGDREGLRRFRLGDFDLLLRLEHTIHLVSEDFLRDTSYSNEQGVE